jgi:FAD/FMN-containing dehydrogenase
MLLATNAVAELRARLNSRVITPADADYDMARTVFNGGVDRRPAAIVRVASADDVARVVSLARKTGLGLAIRSGGHSVAGHSVTEGGIVLDLSQMRALQIDAQRRTAWAETGLTAGAYTNATATYGLATGFGDTRSVGIGGLTLGGGIGYLVRKHGLTIDDLLAAEIVTADGRLLRADAESHPDLFWAIRGGGGNFGVATRLQFRLHELDTIVGGVLILPATPDVIAGFIAAAEAAPDELSAIANIMIAPPLPTLPKVVHGKPILQATLVYAGEVANGERALASFRALAAPVADMMGPMRYRDIYPPEAGEYHPVLVARTLFMEQVDRSVAATILDHLQAPTGLSAVAQLRVLGGAMARVPADATAFGHRRSKIMAALFGLYERPEEQPVHEAWAAGFVAALRQGDAGAYVNFLGDEGEARVRAAYPGSTWERLVAIKRRYDPANLFRLNQNISPGARGSGNRE